jgi:hypothetical protein
MCHPVMRREPDLIPWTLFWVRRHLQPESDRSVVAQRHLHVGAKFASGDDRVLLPGQLHKQVEQLSTQVRRCGRAEAGAVAAPSIGRQRELRHQQQPAALLAEVEIHFPVAIRKHPVCQQSFQQSLSLSRCVTLFNTQQHQQAGANPANFGTGNGDMGMCDTL